MIFRIWHGWTTPEHADSYESLLNEEISHRINGKDIPGLKSVQLLRRTVEKEIEFVTILAFESINSVRTFAGEDYEAAVVHPQARAILSRFDERVQHYEVRINTAEGRQPRRKPRHNPRSL